MRALANLFNARAALRVALPVAIVLLELARDALGNRNDTTN
ncbi:MAG: hypothetical protein ABJH68_12335 [Ilumatobacter sp.]